MQDIIQFSCLMILIDLWFFYLFFEKWMDWGWEKYGIYHINVWVHFRGQYCSSGHSYEQSLGCTIIMMRLGVSLWIGQRSACIITKITLLSFKMCYLFQFSITHTRIPFFHKKSILVMYVFLVESFHILNIQQKREICYRKECSKELKFPSAVWYKMVFYKLWYNYCRSECGVFVFF